MTECPRQDSIPDLISELFGFLFFNFFFFFLQCGLWDFSLNPHHQQ